MTVIVGMMVNPPSLVARHVVAERQSGPWVDAGGKQHRIIFNTQSGANAAASGASAGGATP